MPTCHAGKLENQNEILLKILKEIYFNNATEEIYYQYVMRAVGKTIQNSLDEEDESLSLSEIKK